MVGVGRVVGVASTPDEVRAVQRLRYDVYVEELGRYRAAADHDQRLLAEAEDEHSWLLFAEEDGAVVATTRLTWGGAGFSPRQVEQYQEGAVAAAVVAQASEGEPGKTS